MKLVINFESVCSYNNRVFGGGKIRKMGWDLVWIVVVVAAEIATVSRSTNSMAFTLRTYSAAATLFALARLQFLHWNDGERLQTININYIFMNFMTLAENRNFENYFPQARTHPLVTQTHTHSTLVPAQYSMRRFRFGWKALLCTFRATLTHTPTRSVVSAALFSNCSRLLSRRRMPKHENSRLHLKWIGILLRTHQPEDVKYHIIIQQAKAIEFHHGCDSGTHIGSVHLNV